MAVSGVLNRAALVLAAVGMFSVSHAAKVTFLSDAVFKSPWVGKGYSAAGVLDSAADLISVRDTSIPAFEGTKCIRLDYDLDALDSTGTTASHWAGFGYWMFTALNLSSVLKGPDPVKYFSFALQGPSGANQALRINLGSSDPTDTSKHSYAAAFVPAVPLGQWAVVNVPTDSFSDTVYLGHLYQVDFSVVGAGGTEGTGTGTVFIDDVVFADSMNSISGTSVKRQVQPVSSTEPTGLTFRAVQSGRVTMSVYALNGVLATQFIDNVTQGNTYSVTNQEFSSRFSNLSSGSYYVRVNGAGVNARGILIR